MYYYNFIIFLHTVLKQSANHAKICLLYAAEYQSSPSFLGVPLIVLYKCESKKSPPEDLWQFFQNSSEFFNQILHAYSAFYAILQIFIQLPATLTKLCHIKCDHPAYVSVDGGHFEHIMVVALNMA